MPILVDVRVGESLSLDGGRITLRLMDKSGQRARLSIDAPPDVPVTLLAMSGIAIWQSGGRKLPAAASAKAGIAKQV